MPKRRPPETLDRVRALLDQAAVARTLLPIATPVYDPRQLAETLGVPVASVAALFMADVERDRIAVIVPGDAHIDLLKLAAALGARRARLVGSADRRHDQPAPLPAPVTTVPAVMDRALLSHAYVYAGTGDPLWALRITPAALRKVNGAIVADVARDPAGGG
jgi:prolyl-tRNA editing enzyme YbaK/EbsC (Cys-tRNA(Pro) deacylase)